ncbi:hypothetical protein HZS_5042 [Henneguya salminicola]|nr:hypothetical protein HZS_5042 [Henneguya salminicola]
MESILESFRVLHEEKERLIDEMVQELVYKKRNLRDEINSGHRFKLHLDRYMKCSEKLLEMYEDNDDLKKEEVSAISGANEFAEFYGRIRNSKEFHRKYPDTTDTLGSEFEALKKSREKNTDEELLVNFTDEESYGRFLDMNLLYNQFINISGIKSNQRFNRLTYIEYLSIVDRLYDLSLDIKNNSEYESYIYSLKQYLLSFIHRSKPLLDIESEISDSLRIFDEQWSCGDFLGWNTVLLNTILQCNPSNPQIYQLPDFKNYDSSKDLESLGSDQLKNILQSLGLKCGGTLFADTDFFFTLHKIYLLYSNYSF